MCKRLLVSGNELFREADPITPILRPSRQPCVPLSAPKTVPTKSPFIFISTNLYRSFRAYRCCYRCKGKGLQNVASLLKHAAVCLKAERKNYKKRTKTQYKRARTYVCEAGCYLFVRSCCWGKFSEATTTCAIAVISATINIIINITDRLIGAGDGGRSKDLSLYPSLFLGWLFAVVVVVVVVVRVRKVEISVGNISRSVPGLVAKCGKQCVPPVRVYLAKNVPAMYGCVCVCSRSNVRPSPMEMCFVFQALPLPPCFLLSLLFRAHYLAFSKDKECCPQIVPLRFLSRPHTHTQPVHLIAIPLYF